MIELAVQYPNLIDCEITLPDFVEINPLNPIINDFVEAKERNAKQSMK